MNKKNIIIICTLCMVVFVAGVAALGKIILDKKQEIKIETTYTSGVSDKVNVPRAIMVDGQIYVEVGEVDIKRCGMMDGTILTQVDSTQMPTKDDESNFGVGFPYQKVEGIDVYIDDKWIRFEKQD